MDMTEVSISTLTNSSTSIAMTMRHIPTGAIAKGSGTSLYKLKAQLKAELTEAISLAEEHGAKVIITLN